MKNIKEFIQVAVQFWWSNTEVKLKMLYKIIISVIINIIVGTNKSIKHIS